MIAGTYTIVCYLSLSGTWRISIISVQWGLVALGLILKFIWLRSPRWLNTGIYLLMGWVAVVALKPLYDNISTNAFISLISGGLVYSVGAVIYAIKKPNPLPGLFGFHEIFHLFILAATVIHFNLVYQVLLASII